jgi:hypothetical protein
MATGTSSWKDGLPRLIWYLRILQWKRRHARHNYRDGKKPGLHYCDLLDRMFTYRAADIGLAKMRNPLTPFASKVLFIIFCISVLVAWGLFIFKTV